MKRWMLRRHVSLDSVIDVQGRSTGAAKSAPRRSGPLDARGVHSITIRGD